MNPMQCALSILQFPCTNITIFPKYMDIVTLYNVCSVHRGMLSTLVRVQYIGRTMSTLGDIISTSGVFSTLGDIMISSGFLFSNCLKFYLKMWVVQAEFALYKNVCLKTSHVSMEVL